MSLEVVNRGNTFTSIDWEEMLCFKLDHYYERRPSSEKATKVYHVSSGTNVLRPPSVILNALHQDHTDWKYINVYSGPLGNTLLRGAALLYEESLKGSPLSDVNVAITAGAAEALRLACEYLQASGRASSVLVAGPQYPLVYQALSMASLPFQELLSQQKQRFLPSPHEIEIALRASDSDALFLTEPNNPSGEQHSFEEFAEIVSMLKRSGIYLILDKVGSDCKVAPNLKVLDYGVLLDRADYWDRVFVIDSLSKRRAISGLRFGYLIGTDDLLHFVLEHRFGSCPPHIAVEGIALDLFYSSLLQRRSLSHHANNANHLNSAFLACRLAKLSNNSSECLSPLNQFDIDEYEREVQTMYRIIHRNKEVCSKHLAEWIVSETSMLEGFNYLLCLRVPGRLENEYTFATQLFDEVGVASYPLTCFVADPRLTTTKATHGYIWLRVSCALEEVTFAETVDRMRYFLIKHC